jgi:hypothetical protein
MEKGYNNLNVNEIAYYIGAGNPLKVRILFVFRDIDTHVGVYDVRILNKDGTDTLETKRVTGDTLVTETDGKEKYEKFFQSGGYRRKSRNHKRAKKITRRKKYRKYSR